MKIIYQRSVKINVGNYENTDIVVGLEVDVDLSALSSAESQAEEISAAFAEARTWVNTKLKSEIQTVEDRGTTRFGMEP